MPHAPADEYRARLGARRETYSSLTRLDARFSYARLAVFGGGVLCAIAAWRGWIAPWWLAIPLVVFALLVVRHDRVMRRRDAAARAIAFYEWGLARIEDRWAGTGDTGERFRNPDHLYAQDLDLFGPGSLFELLSIARTRAGEETLAGWLMAPADATEILARQQATDDLAPRLDLREALSLAGADIRASVHSEAVVAWAEGPPHLNSRWIRPVATILTLAAIVTGAAWIATGDSTAFIAVVLLEITFSLPLRQRIASALHGADGPARDLDVLAVVLARLEQERFTAERLAQLQRQLAGAGTPASPSVMAASASIRRLHRLVELHDWQHNMVFAPFSAAVLWSTHLALAIEAWRRAHGRDVREWLRISGEFEAIASLSAYHYEHPDDPFPEIVTPPSRQGVFDGVALGHPLIPAERMVRNDVHLGEPPAFDSSASSGSPRAESRGESAPQLLVVSGSNMSGKSTLLRTVGVNAVLAFAGAPVRARALRLTPLRIGATLRIQDSLQEGRSRFYAEITRIRDIADLASGAVPVLFLLDELFHGTNSHDRVVGASGVLRALLNREAIGLITTHDLALTKVADDLAPRAVNVHFDDRFEGGEIQFDYVMKTGPVTRSNAIALMRAVGLDVPEPNHDDTKVG
jgi:MutS-like protein